MQFHIHHIKSPQLKPWIQYVLFNQCNSQNYIGSIRSFANTNYCLGILKDKKLQGLTNGEYFLQEKPGINSYLTGIYLEPFDVSVRGQLDEICIDFTPLGYYQFFRFAPKTFLLNEDVLIETFGIQSLEFFERIFECCDIKKRGALIEEFLVRNILSFSNTLLYQAISLIHKNHGAITVGDIAKSLMCNEKSIYRLFTNHLDISPKEYIRVVRFRNSLNILNTQLKNPKKVPDDHLFFDQSHFIKEIKYFTGNTPKKILEKIHIIQDTVWMGLNK